MRLWKTDSDLSLYPQCLGQSLQPTVVDTQPMFVEWFLKFVNFYDSRKHVLLQFCSGFCGQREQTKSVPSMPWPVGPFITSIQPWHLSLPVIVTHWPEKHCSQVFWSILPVCRGPETQASKWRGQPLKQEEIKEQGSQLRAESLTALKDQLDILGGNFQALSHSIILFVQWK